VAGVWLVLPTPGWSRGCAGRLAVGPRRAAGGVAIGNWHHDVDPDQRWAGLQWRRFGEHGTAALMCKAVGCRFWVIILLVLLICKAYYLIFFSDLYDRFILSVR
jgi:hypothetical protein